MRRSEVGKIVHPSSTLAVEFLTRLASQSRQELWDLSEERNAITKALKDNDGRENNWAQLKKKKTPIGPNLKQRHKVTLAKRKAYKQWSGQGERQS
ncbi:hypothetical protein PoB_001259300 [Plakobranchus ocellatus]|uniref:Uncharacterized protein n=1 Tax=Plakobranchus ocellatus TaxID=259542 RepID=A0AAV3YU58_9GAST|nr:hypothetical protein PoB_001259300 [Plakobranchus ocellatus]